MKPNTIQQKSTGQVTILLNISLTNELPCENATEHPLENEPAWAIMGGQTLLWDFRHLMTHPSVFFSSSAPCAECSEFLRPCSSPCLATCGARVELSCVGNRCLTVVH